MKICVLFYAYNQEKFVRAGLESIFSQELRPACTYQLIVIDDASSDATANVISEVLAGEASLGESQWEISFLQRPPGSNAGQSATLKEGLSMTEGDYVAILEGDDYWLSTRHISNLVDILERHPVVPVAFSSWISLDNAFNLIDSRIAPDLGEFVSFNQLIAANLPGTLSACLYRATALTRISAFVNRQSEIADWGLNLACSQLGPIFWHPEASVVYRHTQDSLWRKIPRVDRVKKTATLLTKYSESFQEPARQMALDQAKFLFQSIKLTRRIANASRHPLTTLYNLIRK